MPDASTAMAPDKRKNLATTNDGSKYNKRKRPDDLTAPRSLPPPPSQQLPPLNAQPARYQQWKDFDAPPLDAAKSASGSSDEAPGSPVDRPDTHFGTFAVYDKKSERRVGRANPTYGQNTAFPGLSDEGSVDGGDEDGDGLPDDPMRYLRMVRAEAGNLPSSMAKPRLPAGGANDRDMYTNGTGDGRGYYSDGAYVAAPVLGPMVPPGFRVGADEGVQWTGEAMKPNDASIDAQVAYNGLLLARFDRNHNLLHAAPPERSTSTLTTAHQVAFPRKLKPVYYATLQWLKTFVTAPPHPAQLALMDSGMVLKLLDLAKHLLQPGKNIGDMLSVWIWALLCRLNHINAMGSEEVSLVRELAVRALRVRCGFTGEGILEVHDKVDVFSAEDEEFFHVLGEGPPMDPKGKNKAKDGGGAQDAEGDDAAMPAAAPLSVLDVDSELQEQLRAAKELLVAKERLLARCASPSPPPNDTPPKPLPTKAEAFLGKSQAKHLLRSLALSPESPSEDESVVTSDTGTDDDTDAGQGADVPEIPDVNTRATLDMIVAIACEVYGQKDLMKYREIWGEYDYLLEDEGEIEEV